MSVPKPPSNVPGKGAKVPGIPGATGGSKKGKSGGSIKRIYDYDEDGQPIKASAPTRVQHAAGRTAKNVGRTAETAGKTMKHAGKAAEFTGKAMDKTGQAASEAGKKGVQAGSQLSGTGLGSLVGVPLAIGSAGLTAGGYGLRGAGKATEKGGKATSEAGKKVEQTGKAVKEKGKQVQASAANQGKKEVDTKKKVQDTAKAVGTKGGREKLLDKVDPTMRAAKAADEHGVGGGAAFQKSLKLANKASAKAGKVIGGVVTGGANPAGAKSGEFAGKVAFRSATIGIPLAILFVMGAVFSIFAILDTAEDDTVVALPSATPTEETEEELGDLLDEYRLASYGYAVPWPIVAGIGKIASENGTINPYTLEEIDSPDSEHAIIEPLDGEPGGYGPLMLSQWTVDNYLNGNTDSAQNASLAMDALNEALFDIAEEVFDDLCLYEEEENEDGEPVSPRDLIESGDLPRLCQAFYGSVEREEAVIEAAPDSDADADEESDDPAIADVIEASSGDIDEQLVRIGAMTREVLNDEEWESHLEFWYTVLTSAEIVDFGGNQQCLAQQQTLTVPQQIDLAIKCEAHLIEEIYVYEIVNDSIEQLEREEAITRLVNEAVMVSWVYSQWGTADTCDPDGTTGGIFPIGLPAAPPSVDVGDADVTVLEGETGRCNSQLLAEQAADILLQRAQVPASERPGNDYEKVMYEWRGIPGATGSSPIGNSFATDGFGELEGNWSTRNRDECSTSLLHFYQQSFTREAVLDGSWSLLSSTSTEDEIKDALDTMSDVPGWDAVESDCGPMYVENEVNGRYVPDNGWARMVVSVYSDFDADGSLRSQLDSNTRAFINYHQAQDSLAVLTPDWGVTSSVQRMANPLISNVTPNWAPIASTDSANDIMRAALEYIGEDASAFFSRSGGDIGGLIAAGVPPEAAEIYMSVWQQVPEFAPECQARVSLIAAIGRVESNHGNINGGSINVATGDVLTPDGRGIVGPPLDGTGRGGNLTTYWDSNFGDWDYDTTYDRALGPMQFIPSTWWGYTPNTGARGSATQHRLTGRGDIRPGGRGQDFSGDGIANPHNYYDAVGAAILMMCDNGNGLTTREDEEIAVRRYNNSQAYVDKVMAEADRIDAILAQSSFTIGGFGGGANAELMEVIDWAARTMPGTPYSQCWGSFPRCGPGNRYGYVRGANDPHFDCSGLVARVYKEYGVRLPALDTNSMVTQLDNSGSALNSTLVARRSRGGAPISEAVLQPGDALIYRGHMGMYIGNGQVLESQSVESGTNITSYSGKNWGSRATHVFRPAMLPRSNDIPEFWPLG